MIRKLLLPFVAVSLLGGCVTSSYSYRHGHGDYYHGEPSVDYRYYGSYYGGPYGYGSLYYGGPYRYPYGYYDYYDYYGYPYYPYYGGGYYHYGTHRRPSSDPTPDRTRSPWRDLDDLRRRGTVETLPRHTGKPMPRLQPRPAGVEATVPRSQPRIEMPSRQPRSAPAPRIEMPSRAPRSAPAPRADSSGLGGMVRRAGRKSDPTDENAP